MTSSDRSIRWLARAAAPLWLGLWFGLATGLLEAGHIALLLWLKRLPLYTVSDVYPLAAPVVNALFFGLVGLLLWGLNCCSRKPCPLRGVLLLLAMGFSTVLVWNVSEHWLPLHPVAQALLALGLAVQLARWLAAHDQGLGRVVFGTAPVLVLIVAGIGIAHFQESRFATGSTRAAAPPTPDAPNVLFIVMDTVRAQSLSLYGYATPTTPNLARLAERGVVFERAIASAPWTLPSHASMFTGQDPQDLSADWCSPLDARHRTLAEEMAARGYDTCGVVANVYYCGRHTGLDRGFGYYQCSKFTSLDLLRNCVLGRMLCESPLANHYYGGPMQWAGRKDAEQVNAEFLDWLYHRSSDRPYFAFLNYFDAHDPYRPGDAAVDWESSFADGRKPDYSPDQLARLRDSYERCIEGLDARIGQLLGELERRGELKNTLVIITSDHGEQLGEHHLVGHNSSLYQPVIHVPLVIIDPGWAPAGVRVPEVVGLRELAATVLEATGGKNGSTIPGRSLARFWATGEPPVHDQGDGEAVSQISQGINAPPWYPNADTDLRSVWAGGLHYIRGLQTGREELYDVQCDPDEEHNLVDDPRVRSQLESFRRRVAGSPPCDDSQGH